MQAARQLAASMICYGHMPQPGEARLDGGQRFYSPSGTWWVVDARAFDHLKAALRAASPSERTQAIAALFREVEAHVVLKGRGPVAPTFDEFDVEVEAARGEWYVVDGEAFQAFRDGLET